MVHQHGRDVRLERWQTECPQCDATVILRAKLASGLRSKFYARRYNVPPSEVVAVQLGVLMVKTVGKVNRVSTGARVPGCQGNRVPSDRCLVPGAVLGA